MADRIRVGILLDSLDLYAWQRLAIEKVRALDQVDLVLVVLNSKVVKGAADLFAYRVFRRLDRLLFKVAPDAFDRQNAKDLFAGIDQLGVMPRQTRFSDYIEGGDIETIRGYDLDVLVRFGFRILRGEILTVARCGVWSYHHGDSSRYRGGPPCLWELIEGAPATGTVLQILNEDLDRGLVVYRSWAATDKLSLTRSKNRVYWKSASFLARALVQLHLLGHENFQAKIAGENAQGEENGARLYRLKDYSNFGFSLLVVRHLVRNLRRKLDEWLHRDQWYLLVGKITEGNPAPGDLPALKMLLPPKDRFWADPFVITRQGHDYIFFEEYLYRQGRGRLCRVEIDGELQPSAAVTVIDEDHHLSYPFVFEHRGEVYLIAEARAKRVVPLYRSVDFPDRWQWVGNLLEGVDAVDATLIRHAGTWWLFANLVENPGASSCDELFLFFADDLFARTWRAHPCNPVVSDVRHARPAGRLFERDGALYRPGQDCSGEYGRGVRLHRVVELTRESYQEEEVATIGEDSSHDLRNLHTFNFNDRLVVTDARLKRLSFGSKR